MHTAHDMAGAVDRNAVDGSICRVPAHRIYDKCRLFFKTDKGNSAGIMIITLS